MFEDCRNQWSMSRPLLGLIFVNEEVGGKNYINFNAISKANDMDDVSKQNFYVCAFRGVITRSILF